jgi:tRNA-specific 2-thiouridylase
MSGGVDSSVAAALLVEQGHEVVGATMKLWGGDSDSGCCSVSDVFDARRVADHLGIDHHVFNFTEDFDRFVVGHYVQAHAEGRTPNPCVECNRHLKFGVFLERALRLGFDVIATGHHARIEIDGITHSLSLRRGADSAKDQSYVLSVLTARELAKVMLPIGSYTKDEVRAKAASLGLRTAEKPDSQDVCFISSHGREADRRAFLGQRMVFHPGVVIDKSTGQALGEIDAVELITVGQRRGLRASGDGSRRYALGVDLCSAQVTVGSLEDLLVEDVVLTERTWVDDELPVGSPLCVQTSAHGRPRAAHNTEKGIRFSKPERGVAPGQVVACYREDVVVGSGIAC